MALSGGPGGVCVRWFERGGGALMRSDMTTSCQARAAPLLERARMDFTALAIARRAISQLLKRLAREPLKKQESVAASKNG